MERANRRNDRRRGKVKNRNRGATPVRRKPLKLASKVSYCPIGTNGATKAALNACHID